MILSRRKPAANEPIVKDFRQRAPFAAYRPVDYEDYQPFVEFRPMIDGYLEKLFAPGNAIDSGNKNVLDNLIEDMCEKAKQYLERQKIEHTDNIHGISNRRSGDKRAFERQLETLREALAQNEQELGEIIRRCETNKF